MTKLLVFKEKIRKLYSSHSTYILPAIRFVLALTYVLMINNYLGVGGILNNSVLAIIIAACCSLLPVNVIVFLMSLLLIVNIYRIAAEMALVALVIYLIMYIAYFRFSVRYGYVLLVMPIVFLLRIPYLMPLVIGVGLSMTAIVPMVFGTIIFFIMKYAGSEVIADGSKASGVDKASSFLRNVLANKEMFAIILAFVLAALVVYGIKRLSIDHSMQIGIIAGGILELIIIVCATYIFDIDGIYPIWMVAVMGLLAIGISYILQYFVLAVDYSGTEYIQFEDDDYYYYVKAVPKIKVTASDVQVKRINVKKMK